MVPDRTTSGSNQSGVQGLLWICLQTRQSWHNLGKMKHANCLSLLRSFLPVSRSHFCCRRHHHQALFSSCVAVMINNDADISPNSSQWVFPSMLALGGIVTWVDSKRANPFSTYTSPSKGWDRESDETMKRIGIPLWVGACIFLTWAAVLVFVIVLVDVGDVDNVYLEIFETMYRIGSIIFGGGQVVLPMLQDEVVPDWMTKDQFLQGLGLAQSMPGPLFNFSSYLGAVYKGVPGGTCLCLCVDVGHIYCSTNPRFALCGFFSSPSNSAR